MSRLPKTGAVWLPLLPLLFCALAFADQAASEWRDYGRDAARSRFSPLNQITKDNVKDLRVAWVYHAGSNSDALRTSMECNPLVVKGVMFVTSPVLEVIALDAATGRQIWKYDPFPARSIYSRPWTLAGMLLAGIAISLLAVSRLIRRPPAQALPKFAGMAVAVILAFALEGTATAGFPQPRHLIERVLHHVQTDRMKEERRLGPNRGLTYWEDGSDRRIFLAGGHRLVALDAQTGRPIHGFGKNGAVDLTEGLGRNMEGLLFSVSSPGVIYKTWIVIGSLVAEGPEPAAPGHVRAYDVRSGELKWVFHTIPQPGETGYDTWPADAWKRVGGTNAWGGMTVDEGRGLVFVPIGSATFDFYGGDRAGKNLFSDCLVALKADTGKLVWYYQMVHHDLWDYDLPAPPTMVTVERGGKPVDAVVETTKNGFVFVLSRDTGEPLFPVEERAVPASNLDGEQAWPTQPFPLKPGPISRLEITENDLTDLSPEAHAYALRKFREVSGARMFAPPSKSGTIVTPGLLGGANWSGPSFDPRSGRLVINTNDIPYLLEMVDAKPGSKFRFDFRGFFRFLDEQGFPAIKPPWGRLTSVDLNTGEIVWQVPLGEYEELTARGIPLTGTENGGGSITTASGLVFIAATKDRKFRAFDSDNGKVLWETKLDAAGHSTPSTYAVDGRQYVVIAAGGGSMVESASGDEYVAFSLPDRRARQDPTGCRREFGIAHPKNQCPLAKHAEPYLT